ELLVGLVEELAPLRMSDQQVMAPAGQHLRRYLAGEGTLVFPAGVLGADFDRASAERVRDLPEHDRRRQDDGVDHGGIGLEVATQLERVLQSLGDGEVHLQVAGDQRFTTDSWRTGRRCRAASCPRE